MDDGDWVDAGGDGSNPFLTTDPFEEGPWGPTGNSTIDNMTMLEIVGSGGTNNWLRKGARDLIAAYLNASFGLNYPYDTATILADWAALSGSVSGLQTFHAKYSAANELGCPIGAPALLVSDGSTGGFLPALLVAGPALIRHRRRRAAA
jgi:MYXO-CTERM domain-containing protein